MVQVGNGVAWPFHPGPVPFLLGLLAGRFGSGAIFVYLVLVRPAEGETAGHRETVAPTP